MKYKIVGLLCIILTISPSYSQSDDFNVGNKCVSNRKSSSDFNINNERIVKAIIFDIGNVLVKVDLNLWQDGFNKIGVNIPKNMLQNNKLSELVYSYTEGKINTSTFVSRFSNALGVEEIPENEFKMAWNFVILSLHLDAIENLQKFRNSGYKIYALSDNNHMHSEYIDELYQQIYPDKSFFDLFDKVFLSQEIGFRKTSDEAWLYLLKDQKLKPEECLFVDDMLINITRAKKLGLHVFHYETGSDMSKVLETIQAINLKSI